MSQDHVLDQAYAPSETDYNVCKILAVTPVSAFSHRIIMDVVLDIIIHRTLGIPANGFMEPLFHIRCEWQIEPHPEDTKTMEIMPIYFRQIAASDK